ncbi:hypothetical protein QFC19_002762 [Naganishia cerealis]|uniref:Uncharacterized protein n=1 Tax=Naganishia cerealis TaxID=610337 RepID=A0ACC2W8V4_9TREE|nr:hypothetical protein QFC19_002762 [Naganishia cerealis]
MEPGTNEGPDYNAGQIPQISLNNGHQKHRFTPSPSVSPPPTSSSSQYPSMQQTPTKGITLASGSPMLAGLGISGVMTGELEEETVSFAEEVLEGIDTVEKQEPNQTFSIPLSVSETPLTTRGLSGFSSSIETPTNNNSPASPFTVSRKSMLFGRADEHERIHRVREHEHNTFKKHSPPSPTDRSGLVMERFESPFPAAEVSQQSSNAAAGTSANTYNFLDPFGHSQARSRLSSPFDPSSAQLPKQDKLPSLLHDRSLNQKFGSGASFSSEGTGGSFGTSPPPLSPSMGSSLSRANSSTSQLNNRHGTRLSSTFSLTRTPSNEKISRFPAVAESGVDTADDPNAVDFEDNTSPARKWRNRAATLDDEAEEGRNSLPDLPLVPTTPNRMSFTFSQQQHPRYTPAPLQSTGQMRSSMNAPQSGRHLSATGSDFIIPPTPTITPSWQHGRSDSVASNWNEGEHRVHARNLSLFFPQPDANGVVPPPLRSPSMVADGEREAPVTLILPKGEPSKPHSANGFSFGLPPPPRSPSISVGVVGGIDIPGQHTTVDPSKKRRGHHHRHSMSYNFFPFLDDTVPNPAVAVPNDSSTSSLRDPPLSAKPKTVASTLLNGTESTQELEISSIPLLPSPFQAEKRRSMLAKMRGMSPQSQLKAGLGGLELFLGVSLWVDGQLHGNVSMTGLGYLLVFDAMGLLLQVWGGCLTNGMAAQSTIANPFGAILSHNLDITGANNSRSDNSIFLLLVASLSSIISGAFLQNHAKLVEAVGPLLLKSSKGAAFVTHVYKLHPTLGHYLEKYLDNPFSSAVSACCIIAVLAQAFVPVGQTDLSEKSLALVETILAFWLAYPASVAFGKVLLQTAPSQDALQVLAMKKAIREIEAHPSVIRVSRPHVWQLTPYNPRNTTTPVTPSRPKPISRATSHYNRTERSETRQRKLSNTSGSSILVANIVVHLRADVEARKVLEVTRLAYDAIDNAVGICKTKDKWATRGGELSVMVTRGERKQTRSFAISNTRL